MLWSMHASSGQSTLWEFLVATVVLKKCVRQLISSLQNACSFGLRPLSSWGVLMSVFMPWVIFSNGILQWVVLSAHWTLCLHCTQAGLICKWTDDSQHFILEYYNTICNSPSQIYQSALPLSPSKSWLCQYYSSELSQGVKVVKGLQAEWGMYSHTVSFDNIPRTLACWKDLIAVGLEYCDIIILDAFTGANKAVLSWHTGCVNSLAFSSDGALLNS